MAKVKTTLNNDPQVYQTIYLKIRANPMLKAQTLCRNAKASYSGYRYWVRKNAAIVASKTSSTDFRQREVPRERGDHKIAVMIEVEKLQSVMFGSSLSLSLSKEDLLGALSDEELGALVRKAT